MNALHKLQIILVIMKILQYNNRESYCEKKYFN